MKNKHKIFNNKNKKRVKKMKMIIVKIFFVNSLFYIRK